MTDTMLDYIASYLNTEVNNPGIEIPEFIIIDVRSMVFELDSFFNGIGIFDEASRGFHIDYKNIFMDIIQDINERPENVHASVDCSLLYINIHLMGNANLLRDFRLMCNRLKQTMMSKFIELDLRKIMRAQGGYLNYYLSELRGNSVILKHLGNRIIK